MNTGSDLVVVKRGDFVEQVHKGSIVIVQHGKVISSIGDENLVTPMRSTAKPFQVLPLIEAQGIEHFNLSADDLAVMVSSHNGEEFHVNQVRSILKKGEFTINDLKCGIHPPYYTWILHNIYQHDKDGPGPIHNNCSGKHAHMLLLCRLKEWDTKSYWEISHPLQKLILNWVSDCLQIPIKEVGIALDGCGVPTYCVKLRNIALGYQEFAKRLSETNHSALHRVGSSMLSNPYLVAGSNRIETDLMKRKKIIAKSGSSGIFCLAIPEQNLGIAIKIESGSDDASESAAFSVLEQIGYLDYDDVSQLDNYKHIPIKTWTDIACGRYEPIFKL